MQTIELEQESDAKIQLSLFKGVKNLAELKLKVESCAVECCILRPAVIVSTLQIALAAQEAHARKLSNHLITKSVYTELIFNLSPSNNIKESLETFTAQIDDEYCLVVTFSGSDDVFWKFDGEVVDIAELEKLTDTKLVKEIYRIADCESGVSSIEDSVLTRIAVKSA